MTKKLFVIGLCLLGALSLSAQDLYIGQYNIRNANAKDSAEGNGWAGFDQPRWSALPGECRR